VTEKEQLGFIMVVGKQGAPPSSRTAGGGSDLTATILLVAAVCVGLVGIGLILRNRRVD
jgi:hypothetical protein